MVKAEKQLNFFVKMMYFVCSILWFQVPYYLLGCKLLAVCVSNGAVPRVCFLSCFLTVESGGEEAEYAGLTLVELR